MDFWAVTDDPWYPRYKTLIVDPKPSIKRVATIGYSVGGRIGTHMML
jgi:hypothetical protein